MPSHIKVNGHDSYGEFSVFQFFEDDSYECVRDHVTAEAAMQAAKHYTNNVATKMGVVKRVIVTDGGDFICFEWVHGKGVTFPPQEDEVRDAKSH